MLSVPVSLLLKKKATQQYFVRDSLFIFQQDKFFSVARLWKKDAAYIRVRKNSLPKLHEATGETKREIYCQGTVC